MSRPEPGDAVEAATRADEQRLIEQCVAAGAVAGTVHRPQAGVLRLTAAYNIPPPVIERTRIIPRGKGMAGLAWQRAAPVSTCDLQDDPSADVRPGARAVQAGQAVALPVFESGALIAVVGFAFRDVGQIDDRTLDRLGRKARAVAGQAGYSPNTA